MRKYMANGKELRDGCLLVTRLDVSTYVAEIANREIYEICVTSCMGKATPTE